ncbi:nucleolar protein 56 [Chloropicon primus]|uniref:Nucleolar protein 56 n=2 Tax=Chloropicon primus TaxID=1764295 RepID=A0A5B8MWA7_9CHLO|nr:nucleolar protein 56 [Chloropicon primus]UPR03849.1 nucleolar protein 56 [Chloropicon primus]|eukprot:QDZ24641.1 nucleolar protein 56 [Chloropicon primus]
MSKMSFVLYESASGYGLFELVALDEIGTKAKDVQKTISDLSRFSKVMKLKAFQPFTNTAGALEEINAVSEGIMTENLKDFLVRNLPKASKEGKKAKFTLGMIDAKLANAVQEGTGLKCVCDEIVGEVLRGVRNHLTHFIKGLSDMDLNRSQLSLAHSYSRAKVKFNVNKVDNMIIQAISLLDILDRDINTFIMRVKEWYSWHFPELVKLVTDNYMFTRTCLLIMNRKTFTEDKVEKLTEIVGSEDLSKDILAASKHSMGQDISDFDLLNIEKFAKRTISLAEYRQTLHEYLIERMSSIAPNLAELVGELVGARLISHAGSLTNLAKYPASTVQILGAEKALFRALKTKGNTPKYGLIFNSTYIGRASQQNKGRISRYLANKCSIASRIDCFLEQTTNVFGKKLKDQVEERLRFYEDGTAPRKNVTVMQEAMGDLEEQYPEAKTPSSSKKDKKKKRKSTDSMDVDGEDADTPSKKKKKKDKKDKKKKKKDK